MLRGLLETVLLIFRDKRGRLVVLAVTGTFLVGTAFYHFVENWAWIDSFYFTVVTLTTVGYGDLHPTTTGSKLFTTMLILLGVGLILAFLDFLVRTTVNRRIGTRDHGDTG